MEELETSIREGRAREEALKAHVESLAKSIAEKSGDEAVSAIEALLSEKRTLVGRLETELPARESAAAELEHRHALRQAQLTTLDEQLKVLISWLYLISRIYSIYLYTSLCSMYSYL